MEQNVALELNTLRARSVSFVFHPILLYSRMKRIVQLLFPSKNYDAIVAAAIGFFCIYLYTKHSGIGISPDSIAYMSTARNIHAHLQIKDYNESPLVDFPLFYPIFLSAWMFITTLDVMSFAPILNGFLFAVIIYLTGWIIEGFVTPAKWYKYIILSFIIISPCLLEVYSMLWSETLFILLTMLFFISFRYYLQSHSIKRLLLVSCIVSLACVTRYTGITLIGTGGLILLLDNHLNPKKKTIHILLFGSLSIVLLIINLVRNSILSGTLTGEREKSITSFINNVYYFGHVLCDWLPLPENNFAIAVSVVFIFVLFFSNLFLWRFLKKANFYSYENIITVFFCAYTFFMLLSATISRYETFSGRLLSPDFIPMLLGSSCMVPMLVKKLSQKKRVWVTVIIILIAFGFQYNQLMIDYENYDGIKDAGMPGYTEDSWNTNSEIVTFLKNNKTFFKPGYQICSNASEAVYFYTGLYCDRLPHKIIATQLKNYNKPLNTYLVWFNDVDNTELISAQEALFHKKMTTLY